ncbi:MAG: glycerate kinase, partial [Yersinia sp. (in: enterobacteria)]
PLMPAPSSRIMPPPSWKIMTGAGVEAVYEQGIDAVFSILPRLDSLDRVLAQGEVNLQQCARNVAQAIKIGQKLAN